MTAEKRYVYLVTRNDALTLNNLQYGERRIQMRTEASLERWIAHQSQWATHHVFDFTFGPCDKTTMELFKRFVNRHNSQSIMIGDSYGHLYYGVLMGENSVTRIDWRGAVVTNELSLRRQGPFYAQQQAITVGYGQYNLTIKILAMQGISQETGDDLL